MPTIRNFNNRNLTPEQQRLINMYINQYNQTNSHIELLLDMLDEIRGNIINVINITQPRRTRINRHSRNSNANINRLINERQNNYIYYDFNNPINPSIYNDYINGLENNFSNGFTTTFNNSHNMSFNNINRNTDNNAGQTNNLASFLANFLDTTVSVRPTTEQIDRASRLVRYGNIDNPLSESCPISLDEFNDDNEVRQLLPCGHIFNPPQFQEWFSENVICPVCRYDIRNYHPLSRRNTPTNNTTSEQTTSTNNTQTTNTNTQTTNHRPEQPQGTTLPIATSTASETTQNTPVSNINVIRDPLSNQNEHLTFDIDEQQFTNNFLDTISRNIIQSMLNPQTQNNNDRFMIDPSNNILFYETIIRPNNNENN